MRGSALPSLSGGSVSNLFRVELFILPPPPPPFLGGSNSLDNSLMRKFVKVMTLWLTRPFVIKTWGEGGVEVYFHAFLCSALDGDKWSASYPSCFTGRERAPGTKWIWGWVVHTAILDTGEDRNIYLYQELNPNFFIHLSCNLIILSLNYIGCIILRKSITCDNSKPMLDLDSSWFPHIPSTWTPDLHVAWSMCVLHTYHNKQWLYPYITLTFCSL